MFTNNLRRNAPSANQHTYSLREPVATARLIPTPPGMGHAALTELSQNSDYDSASSQGTVNYDSQCSDSGCSCHRVQIESFDMNELLECAREQPGDQASDSDDDNMSCHSDSSSEFTSQCSDEECDCQRRLLMDDDVSMDQSEPPSDDNASEPHTPASDDQVGGFRPRDHYRVLGESRRVVAKFGGNELTRRIRVQVPQNQGPGTDGQPNIPDYLNFLGGILDDACANAVGALGEQDRVRLVIDSDSLKKPISTTLVRKRDFRAELLLAAVERVVQSNEGLALDQSFNLMIQTIQVPRGGRSPWEVAHLTDIQRARRNMRCIVRIVADQNLCLPAAVELGRVLADTEKKTGAFRNLQKHKQRGLSDRARALYEAALGRRYGPMCTFADLDAFQAHMVGYQLVVFGWAPKAVVYRGPPARKMIALFYDRQTEHFDLITTPGGFLGCNKFCNRCLVGYDHDRDHRCANVCSGCLSKDCPDKNVPPNMFCSDCNRYFPTQRCLDGHKLVPPRGKWSLCHSTKKCGDCGRRIDPKNRQGEGHVCGELFCRNCRMYVTTDHLCYIKSIAQPLPPGVAKEPGEVYISDMERTEFENRKIVYFDIEAYTDVNNDMRHVCNLVVARDNMGGEPHDFYGANAMGDFMTYAISPENRHTTFVAHNFKGYDGYHIINWLLNHTNEKIKVISVGSKLMMLQVTNFHIQFIDSLNFFQASLAKLPRMFGLDAEVSKGFFPHVFNAPENFDYDGPMPDIANYMPDEMTPARRQEFHRWYNEKVATGYRFVFQTELVSYCTEDVNVLLGCCEKFRQLFFNLTSVDPFRYVTIAACCNAVWRKNDLEDDTVAIIPPKGYAGRDKHSHGTIEWMSWLEHHTGTRIRHARNGPEIRVVVDGGRILKLDGLFVDDPNVRDNNKRALEYAGCFIHGCSKCHHGDLMNPLRMKTMAQLNEDFIRRNLLLRKAGYHVTVKWECEWSEDKLRNPLIGEFLADLKLEPPLVDRDALYGGRTNAIALYHSVLPHQKLRYIDFTSLYPFVNKNRRYPVGHPKILVGPEIDVANLDRYFGLIHCKVRPPHDLYHPILPSRVRGKLMFVLCPICAQSSIPPPCTHSEDERCLKGTWVTEELQSAIVYGGYEVEEVYEVWHFEKSDDRIFSSYMDRFYAVKTQSAGWPSGVESEAEKTDFVRKFEDAEGVRLDPSKISKNPGLYAVSKLMLNSLWGKLAQRQNMGSVKFIQKEEQYWKVILSEQFCITNIEFHGDVTAQINYKDHDDFVAPGLNTNVPCAAFTTFYGRDHLWPVLNMLGRRVLYCDTDSVIFVDNQDPNEEVPELGSYMGEFKDELGEGKWGVEFVSGGPKNYGLKLNTGTTMLKVRGFTLNALGTQDLNYGVVRQLVREGIAPDGTYQLVERRVRVGMGTTIKRDAVNWTLHTVPNVKHYELVYDKRFICADLTTLPWGWKGTM